MQNVLTTPQYFRTQQLGGAQNSVSCCPGQHIPLFFSITLNGIFPLKQTYTNTVSIEFYTNDEYVGMEGHRISPKERNV